MKLYYFDGSTACRPVVMLAHEAGIPLDLVPVNLFGGEHMQPPYLAMNPNGKVPLLDDDGFLLTECSAILKYLAEVSGSPAYPTDVKGRARVNAQMDWFNTGFYRRPAYLLERLLALRSPQEIGQLFWGAAMVFRRKLPLAGRLFGRRR